MTSRIVYPVLFWMAFGCAVTAPGAVERPVDVPSSSPGLSRAARLTLPDSGPVTHGVVLLPVAGPTGSDMDLGARGIYSSVAGHLAEAGIASLRIADRGVEGSGGNWMETDLEVRTADAAAALDWFRSQPALRDAAVGVLGISEGGAIALLLGASSPGPDFVIALSVPMENGEETLRWQRDSLLATSPLPAEQKRAFVAESDRFIEAVMAGDGETVRSVLEGPMGPFVIPPYRFVPSSLPERIDFALSPWYSSQVVYDIEERVGLVRSDVLAVYGSLDRVIDPETSAELLHSALGDRGGSSATVRIDLGLNHLMMPAVTGSPLEYGTLPDIISGTLWDDLSCWIASR